HPLEVPPLTQALSIEHLCLLLVAPTMEPDIPTRDKEQHERPPIPGLLHEWQELLIQEARQLLVALDCDHDPQRTQHHRSVQRVPLLLVEPQTFLVVRTRRSRIA